MKSILFILILSLSACSFFQKESKEKILQEQKNVVVEESETPQLDIASEEYEFADEPQEQSALIKKVLTQLNLEPKDCKFDLIREKINPINKNESIVVIPEIALQEEDYFELNSHILIVNSTTGKILHKYYESSKTNDWEIGAVYITDISIDTAPYYLKKNSRAFGIRVHHLGSSKPNPYEAETISLFIKNKNSLKRVLDKYEVNGNYGEWDMNCYGSFTYYDTTLIISKAKTNTFNDIIANHKVTVENNIENQNGDCISETKTSTSSSILKYSKGEYKTAPK